MNLRRAIVTAVFVLPLTATAAQQWVIVDPPGQDALPLSSGVTGAHELSGISSAGGNLYYSVSDNNHTVYPLMIAVDPASGRINSANLGAGTQLAVGSDIEGVAYNATGASVFVSDESGPAIREHAVADGSLLQTLSVPTVFSSVRSNLSLESLSREAGGGALWTCNEEALSVDGPVSSFSAGTVVRLQKFDADLHAAGQWAYVTDAIDGDIVNPGRDIEVSGVSDLLALPGGQLLVMERELGIGLFRHRIYEVDFSAASDVSAIADLSSASYTPVGKILLWEHFGVANYEGITIGPDLANHGRSVLLVSDDGGSSPQALLALILLPNVPVCTPQPLVGCRPAVSATLAVASRDGTHDKLTWAWRKGTLADLSAFDDPTIPVGHGFSLCLYDSLAGTPQLQVSAAMARGVDWKLAGTTSYKYADNDAARDGIAKVKLRSGAGKAEVQVKAKGVALGLPSPPLVGNLLNRDPEITVQFVNRDSPTECFTTSFSAARRESAEQFKAKF